MKTLSSVVASGRTARFDRLGADAETRLRYRGRYRELASIGRAVGVILDKDGRSPYSIFAQVVDKRELIIKDERDAITQLVGDGRVVGCQEDRSYSGPDILDYVIYRPNVLPST